MEKIIWKNLYQFSTRNCLLVKNRDLSYNAHCRQPIFLRIKSNEMVYAKYIGIHITINIRQNDLIIRANAELYEYI